MSRALLTRLLRWLPILLLLAVALHPWHPILLPLREAETPLLLLGAGLGIALASRRARRGPPYLLESRLLVAVQLVVMVLAVCHEDDFRRQRQAVLAAEPAMRTLGQHFMVGYTRYAEVAVLAERGLIGGIYLGRHNVRDRTVMEIRDEVAALQRLRARAGLPPLLVAADQEGGKVAHLTPPLAALPSLASLVAAGSDSTLELRARNYGQAQGQGLAGLGVNLNFGPVVDLRPGHGGAAFDTHTRIAQRAIAADPAVVARVARAYGEGLAAAGVTPTLKHFPGLGRVTTDTHHFPARLDSPAALLATTDWRPFRTASSGATAMMLGHVVVPDLDPVWPASLSRTVVQDLLRTEWGYDGLLITDDLNMGAVYRRGICSTAVAALTAGADLLLISYDPDQYYRAMHCAAAALDRGLLDSEQLAVSRQRIASLATRPARQQSTPQPGARLAYGKFVAGSRLPYPPKT